MAYLHSKRLSDLNWVDLEIPPHQMLPENTLNMGQCFNWKRLHLSNEQETQSKYWVGVLQGQPMIVKQLPRTTAAASLLAEPPMDPITLRSYLRSYFQLQEDLPGLYSTWSERCGRMSSVAECLRGVRVVRQDPWECLISFICSSNNNIARISLMLDRLRSQYGQFLCSVKIENAEGRLGGSEEDVIIEYIPPAIPSLIPSNTVLVKEETSDDKDDDLDTPLSPLTTAQGDAQHRIFPLYSFPTVNVLATLDESALRSLGMGYRAKFIVNSAKLVQEKTLVNNEDWLLSLRNPLSTAVSETLSHRKFVQSQLLQLPGVGMKVADCVALFSLDQSEVIPVDTHVWSIAVRDYAPHLKLAKSLTPTIYDQVGDVFRDLFQRHAGWAHSVLFAAELPAFRALLPKELQDEMVNFALEQKREKALKKESKANTPATANTTPSVNTSAKSIKKMKVLSVKEEKGAADGAQIKPIMPVFEENTVETGREAAMTPKKRKLNRMDDRSLASNSDNIVKNELGATASAVKKSRK